MIVLAPLAVVISAFLGAAPGTHFQVSAGYAPGKAGRPGEVAVTFRGSDPDVRINQAPAPRLAFEDGAPLVVDKVPAPAKGAHVDASDEAKYLDTSLPVAFPVSLASGAPRGTHSVRGTVTYFYCSKREGWCRKGTAPIEVAVKVP